MIVSRRRILAVLAAALLLASVLSAGCISALSPLPQEVMVRENIISVDSEYVSTSLIVSLLLNPNRYEPGLFAAVDEYLPQEHPVIEVGAGIGAVSAYVNDRLSVRSDHIAVEPNPYYIPLLEKTKEINGLGTRFVQMAVDYNAPVIPYAVSRNVVNAAAISAYTEDMVNVHSVTVSELIRSSAFADSGNITLIVDVDGVCLDILNNEPSLSQHVSLIIATVTDEDAVLPLQRKASSSGYVLSNTPEDDGTGLITLVFARE